MTCARPFHTQNTIPLLRGSDAGGPVQGPPTSAHQTPAMAAAGATTPPGVGPQRRPASPGNSPERKFPRPSADLSLALAALDDALQRRDEQVFCQRVRDAFATLQVILATWTADMAVHAQGLEHHHSSLYKASIAVGSLKVRDAELEAGITGIQPRLGLLQRQTRSWQSWRRRLWRCGTTSCKRRTRPRSWWRRS